MLIVTAAFTGVSCRQDMHDQPRYKPLQHSSFFADGRSARPLPANTVARGHLNDTQPQYTGVDSSGRFLDTLPVAINRQMIDRGRERYGIYCSPCHGLTGDAQGMVALRGFRAPPSFHTDRARRLPAGYLFAVISNGFGGMPDYSDQIAADDRWAIVTYVRALQISREGTLADVPPDKMQDLERTP